MLVRLSRPLVGSSSLIDPVNRAVMSISRRFKINLGSKAAPRIRKSDMCTAKTVGSTLVPPRGGCKGLGRTDGENDHK